MANPAQLTVKVLEVWAALAVPTRLTSKVVEAWTTTNPPVYLTDKVVESWDSGAPVTALTQKVVEVWYDLGLALEENEWALEALQIAYQEMPGLKRREQGEGTSVAPSGGTITTIR